MRKAFDQVEHQRATSQFAGLPLLEGSAGLPLPPIVRRTSVRAHQRLIQGPPLPSGEQLKAEATAAHELNRVKMVAVEYVRDRLAELYRSRDNDPVRFPVPFVNADDITTIVRGWAECPAVLHSIPGHWKGSVFKKGFVKVRGLEHPSVRASAKGTSLPAWRVR